MKKIYYSDKVVIFGSPADLEQIDSQNHHRILCGFVEQTKLELFSDNSKTIAMICEDWEAQFNNFAESFELIEAGGGIVRNPAGDTLMILRNDKWDLPKGKLEPGERIEECAIREVEEECHIKDLVLENFRAHTFHIYQLHGKTLLKKTWWWEMTHSGEGELTPQTEEGITAVRWVPQGAQMMSCLAQSYPAIVGLLSNNPQTRHDGQR